MVVILIVFRLFKEAVHECILDLFVSTHHAVFNLVISVGDGFFGFAGLEAVTGRARCIFLQKGVRKGTFRLFVCVNDLFPDLAGFQVIFMFFLLTSGTIPNFEVLRLHRPRCCHGLQGRG